jgi:hypothetical protein
MAPAKSRRCAIARQREHEEDGVMMNTKGLWLVAALGLGLGLTNLGCGGAAPPTPATPDPAQAASAGGDADGDGIPDSADKCPDKKEDGQAPDPKDGCPKI